MAKPKIRKGAVADRYAGPDERIAEFNDNTPANRGGLLSLSNISDNSLNLSLYRLDPGVRISVSKSDGSENTYADALAVVTRAMQELNANADHEPTCAEYLAAVAEIVPQTRKKTQVDVVIVEGPDEYGPPATTYVDGKPTDANENVVVAVWHIYTGDQITVQWVLDQLAENAIENIGAQKIREVILAKAIQNQIRVSECAHCGVYIAAQIEENGEIVKEKHLDWNHAEVYTHTCADENHMASPKY